MSIHDSQIFMYRLRLLHTTKYTLKTNFHVQAPLIAHTKRLHVQAPPFKRTILKFNICTGSACCTQSRLVSTISHKKKSIKICTGSAYGTQSRHRRSNIAHRVGSACCRPRLLQVPCSLCCKNLQQVERAQGNLRIAFCSLFSPCLLRLPHI